MFGIEPVTFLRHKRLCVTHSILRESARGTTTVAAVAMQQGSYELGRFPHYYLAMFGNALADAWGRAATPCEPATLAPPASRQSRRDETLFTLNLTGIKCTNI